MKFFTKKRGQKGFTLIELLVVIAIIGILATIVLVSLNTARQKARDTRRVSDMRQVVLALEMYYDDEGQYPGTDDTESWAAMETALEPDYMTSVPSDPGSNTYMYYPGNSNSTYVLVATLEDSNNSQLDSDVDNADINNVTVPAGRCDGSEYCIQP